MNNLRTHREIDAPIEYLERGCGGRTIDRCDGRLYSSVTAYSSHELMTLERDASHATENSNETTWKVHIYKRCHAASMQFQDAGPILYE